MGRVLVDYAVILGIVSTMASIAGAKLITYVNKKFGRGSLVVFIVGIAVGISAILAVIKAIKIFTAGEKDTISANVTAPANVTMLF